MLTNRIEGSASKAREQLSKNSKPQKPCTVILKRPALSSWRPPQCPEQLHFGADHNSIATRLLIIAKVVATWALTLNLKPLNVLERLAALLCCACRRHLTATSAATRFSKAVSACSQFQKDLQPPTYVYKRCIVLRGLGVYLCAKRVAFLIVLGVL